jgi:hypothetical protein
VYGGSRGTALLFLTSAPDVGEWSASRSGHFTKGGKSPLYQLDRRLHGPQSQSGCCGVEKNLLALPGIKLLLSSLQPITVSSELSRLLVKGKKWWLRFSEPKLIISFPYHHMMLSEGKTCSKKYFATQVYIHFLQHEQHLYAIQTEGFIWLLWKDLILGNTGIQYLSVNLRVWKHSGIGVITKSK